jgi:glycerol 3-phosphatase-2
VGPQPGWRVDLSEGAATVSANGSNGGDGLSIVRAVASAVWGADSPPRIEAGDDKARAALSRCSLVA